MAIYRLTKDSYRFVEVCDEEDPGNSLTRHIAEHRQRKESDQDSEVARLWQKRINALRDCLVKSEL